MAIRRMIRGSSGMSGIKSRFLAFRPHNSGKNRRLARGRVKAVSNFSSDAASLGKPVAKQRASHMRNPKNTQRRFSLRVPQGTLGVAWSGSRIGLHPFRNPTLTA
jgi:hypothetical protein